MRHPLAVPTQPLTGRGTLLMLGSVVCIALMAVTIRLASEQLHAFQIAFFRNLFGLAFTVPLILRAGVGLLRTDRINLYVLRCLTGLCSMLTGYWALVNLPLAQAVSLNYTVPLFVTILAVLVLGEIVRIRRWTAVAIGFVGVLVMLRPDVAGLQFAALVALASSALWAGAAICIKFLSRTEPPDAIVIWTVLIMTPLSLFPALTVWQWPTAQSWLWAVAMGGLGTLAQMCMTRAYRLVDVSALQPLNFLQLPIVAFMAWLLFAEHIDIWTAVGASIIFSSTVYIARREAQIGRVQVADPDISPESKPNR